ncbi:MAG: DUF4965 domain-containing protein [Victivallaceae bacterium]|nr:DUF4965 domain-containing protein [Victivallaceae bacterium]
MPEKYRKGTKMKQQYPATPLVVHDPYFSVWSFHNEINGGLTGHWTGTSQNLYGEARIDGAIYSFCGGSADEKMEQISLEVRPLTTRAVLRAKQVELTLEFMTPALPDQLEVMARPLTYVSIRVVSLDGTEHEVALSFEMPSILAVDVPPDKVFWGRSMHSMFDLAWFASARQEPLSKAGDNLRIDYGKAVLAVPHEIEHRLYLGGWQKSRARFHADGTYPGEDDFAMPASAARHMPAASVCFPLGSVGGAAKKVWFALAYDDNNASIEFLGTKLAGYWTKECRTFAGMLTRAYEQYDSLREKCAAFDESFLRELETAGGALYAKLGALSYRQAIGAHKMVLAPDCKTPFFFSKENFSNGCIGTVDVTYPSAPLFLAKMPELLEGMLLPILEYAASPRWKFPFAPHDLGTYPLADGQIYGGGEETADDQMPVEECGNMLILVCALAIHAKRFELFRNYLPLMKLWCNYLEKSGFDPEHQLCTDDFAGKLAHNTNLSIKALVALAAAGKVFAALGETEDAARCSQAAKSSAVRWRKEAFAGDHYSLAFDRKDTWSMKYNLVWDRLLNLDLFPAEVAETEMAFYRRHMQKYGLPLDSRRTYTKLDWLVWCACLTGKREDFDALLAPVGKFLEETGSRVPLTDWYETTDAQKVGFQARSVVGGIYLPLLMK